MERSIPALNLYRFCTQGLVFELPSWGLHVLPRALQTLVRSSAFPIKEYAHALCHQETHSLHLKLLLDPHNRKNASLTVGACTFARPIWPYFKWHKIITGPGVDLPQVVFLCSSFYEKNERRSQLPQKRFLRKWSHGGVIHVSHVTSWLACRLCRTGVIFCVFQANRGETEASAKRELPARGGALKYFSAPRSPRFRLSSPEVRKKLPLFSRLAYLTLTYQVRNEFEFWNAWLPCTFGKFHEKWANYRPCSRISGNKLVISRITGVLSFTDHGK